MPARTSPRRGREGAAVAAAIRIAHRDQRRGGLIGAEAEGEASVRRHMQGPSVQRHQRTGRGAAQGQAALLQAAGHGEPDRLFLLRENRGCGQGEGSADKQPAADHVGVRPFSRARAVAMSGLA